MNCWFLSFLLDTLTHICQASSMWSFNTGAIWKSYMTWPFSSAWSCHPNPIKTDAFPNCCIAISTTPLSSHAPCVINSMFVSDLICLCSLNNVAILYKSHLMASKWFLSRLPQTLSILSSPPLCLLTSPTNEPPFDLSSRNSWAASQIFCIVWKDNWFSVPIKYSHTLSQRLGVICTSQSWTHFPPFLPMHNCITSQVWHPQMQFSTFLHSYLQEWQSFWLAWVSESIWVSKLTEVEIREMVNSDYKCALLSLCFNLWDWLFTLQMLVSD